MTTRIHVSTYNLSRGEPAIVVRKDDEPEVHVRRVRVTGTVEVVHSPRTRKGGVRCWVETEDEVEVLE